MYRPLYDDRKLAATTQEVWGELAAPRNEGWGGVRQGEGRSAGVRRCPEYSGWNANALVKIQTV